MPSYKLIYFQSRGRAEMTRLLFAAAGLEYEDCRLKDRKKAFEELKATGKLPFDQLPVLEVDGKVLAQSTAICKYVGKLTGFAPTDAFEEAKADMIVCGLEDLFASAVKFYMEKDEETKKTLAKEFYGNTLPRSLDRFEKILKSSGGKYFAANKLTYADVMFFSFVELFEQFNKINTDASLLDHHPTLKEHSNTVASQPGIKKWLSERPKI